MQLPHALLPYAEKTVILVCDRSTANFFEAKQRQFERAEHRENDQQMLSDTERYVISVGDGRGIATETDEKLKLREADRFYRELCAWLFERLKTNGYEKLIVVVPHEDKNRLTDHLHTDVRTRLDRVVPKELTKLSEAELIQRLDEERKNP